MQALIFIQKLQQTLLEIKNNGGNRIFFVETNRELTQQIKAYAIDKLRQDITDISNQDTRYFVNDLLSRDIFNLRLKYCIVKLKEFSIEEGDYFGYISKAIDLFLEGRKPPHFFQWPDSANIDDLLTLEVAKCFQPWYRPEDIFLIDFAQDHQLIFRNFQKKNWAISNLGNYFLQMSTFEAIAFLCALEVVLTLEHQRYSFISKDTLQDLLQNNDVRQRPYSLVLFGIVTESYYDGPEITDFGRKVLSYVQENLNLFRDVILFLLESEATGTKYPSDIDFDQFLETIEKSNIMVDDQKKSVQTAIGLYRGGKYLDSLRVIYPILEGTLDSALKTINLKPSSFSGMKSKIEKLEKETLISSKISTSLEIYSSRNKILHGNILDNDPEIMRPLFSMVLAHLKILVLELEKNIPNIEQKTNDI
jgi:hypothetical protein